jgi:hypothetical protein
MVDKNAIILALILVAGIVPLAMTFGPLLFKGRDRRDALRLIGGHSGNDKTLSKELDADTLLELEKLRLADRREERQLHERLTLERLDVIKTAVAMGYSEQQLHELDERLKQHIGDVGMAELRSMELAGQSESMPRQNQTEAHSQ